MAYLPTTRTGTSTNLNPAARSGTNAFGLVPGPVTAPNPFGDLSKVYPNLSQSNNQLSSNILSELHGELSPQTMNAIQDAAATYGVTSGMPGSGLAINRGVRDLGLATEDLQGRGLQDYLNAITGISKTQTLDPGLQTEIATQNSIWNSAPDPEMAAKEQENIFESYLNPGAGTVTTQETPLGPTGKPLFRPYTPTNWNRQ